MTYVYCGGGVTVVAHGVIGVKVGPLGGALIEAEKEGFLREGKIAGQVCENHRYIPELRKKLKFQQLHFVSNSYLI